MASDRRGGSNRQLALLLAAVCIDLCGVALVIPLLTHYARALDLSPKWFGVLQSLYGVAQLFGSPLMGAISDRYGRKQVLLISCVGTATSYFAIGFTSSIPVLFWSRVVVGLVKQTTTASQALAADLTSHQDRAQALGHVGTAISVAFIVFPPLGGWLSKQHMQLPVVIATFCFFIEFVLLWMIDEPEAEPASRVTTAETTAQHSWWKSLSAVALGQLASLRESLGQPWLAILLYVSALRKVAEVSGQFAVSLSLQQRFDFGPESIGWVFSYRSVLSALVTAFAVRPLSRRMHANQLIVSMAVLVAVAEIVAAITPFEGWVLMMPLSALGVGVARTTTVSCLTKAVPSDQLGSLLGVAGSMESIVRIIVPLFAGYLMEVFGPTLPNFLSAGVFILIACLVRGITFPLEPVHEKKD
eukprot:m.163554 g.163554  ORF g.163554 m.163554 type:complete len:415 (+) comp17692_c0_seq3:1371-2615(+)